MSRALSSPSFPSPSHPFLLLTLQSNRSTFATNMNEHSSRSHLVLSVYITGVAKTGGGPHTPMTFASAVGLRLGPIRMNSHIPGLGTTMRGKLHLIDLAGSERLSKTGAQVTSRDNRHDHTRSSELDWDPACLVTPNSPVFRSSA